MTAQPTESIRCPYCGGANRILQSRQCEDYTARRRQCLACRRTFGTIEDVIPLARIRQDVGATPPPRPTGPPQDVADRRPGERKDCR